MDSSSTILQTVGTARPQAHDQSASSCPPPDAAEDVVVSDSDSLGDTSSGDDDKESIEDLSVDDLAFMSNVLNDALFTDAPPFDDLAGVVIPVGDP